MDKTEKKAIEKQEALFKRAEKVLREIVSRAWLSGFKFTAQCGEMDACGIDIILTFNCNVNGGVGKLCAQQKPNISGAKKHLVKYPCVPVYILTKYDSLSLIEYVFLTLMLECEAYSTGKEIEIGHQQKKLEIKHFSRMDPATKHKVFLTKRDFVGKTGKKFN